MALEDFEKELAQSKADDERKQRHRRRDSEAKEDKHHRHHHRSSRHHDSREDEDGHRSKRRRRSRDEEDYHESRRRHRHRHRDEDQQGSIDASRHRSSKTEESRPDLTELKRDSWMEAPSSLDIDYVQRPQRQPSPPKNKSLDAQYELKIHEKELNHHLRDLQQGKSLDDLDEPAKHEVDYTFGDSGSKWRMTKLKAVYRQAEKTGQKVEEAALERYDSLREFDDAREEEIELGRRETYGEGYVGNEKPSGDLFQERKIDAGVRRSPMTTRDSEPIVDEQVEGVAAPTAPPTTSKVLDPTALNKLKAQIMKAQLRKDPKLPELEKQYEEAVAASESQQSNLITLSAMDNRMLSTAPRNEVKAMSGGRNRERGNVEENEDMSIADMVAEERRTRGQSGGAAYRTAERIAKDGKFDNTEDYLDENAAKLAKRVHKSEINLRNTAIQDYQKLNRILDNCALCHHEDTGQPPVAPIVSLGTRTYVTLPTEPELSDGGAVIVPIQHRTNLLECDDDEWEEIRNFMKSLTRLYHDQGRDVIFYENAARPERKGHAAMIVVPLPYSLGETAPAFFQEAFLSSEEEWSQHKKIIHTLKKSKEGLGKLAFRRTIVKEAPYFHVWFEIDGGLGHIVEDSNRWPRGDLFAREIIGGMLDVAPDVVKRQGRWERGHDGRVEGFRKKWRRFDWTRVLTEG
jgi:Protein similar to CwfJ C-terminus 1/Protein similar to CwfJ C-terminus 2